MKRHKSNREGPGARIQLTTRTIRIGRVEIAGFKPRILVTVHAKHIARYKRLAWELGMDSKCVEKIGRNNVYDVCGTEDSLCLLVADECVSNWNYAIDAKAPR